jgi:hypothetical protein
MDIAFSISLPAVRHRRRFAGALRHLADAVRRLFGGAARHGLHGLNERQLRDLGLAPGAALFVRCTGRLPAVAPSRHL